MLFFSTFYSSKNPENKIYHIFHKKRCSSTVFKYEKMFLDLQMIILDGFLKGHVTLQTGVMMLKMKALKTAF